MDPTDSDLLLQYARERSEASFAELVRRHLDLVYSAAKRQVCSAALAEEVAQSVFIDLSRAASKIKPGTPLVAWLHLVTRRTAIDLIRKESRRQSREQLALEISAMESPSSYWIRVEPLLDEAVESLAEPDRHAVLLRYFENKSMREVGAALGLSEDAAQKRVSRALEQLRAIFRKHGIVVTGAGLASELYAHAIQIAPIALSSTVSSAVVALGTAVLRDTTIAQTAHTLAMTAVQKSLVAAVLTVAVGAGLYEATLFARQKAELAALTQRTAVLSAQLSLARTRQNTTAAQLRTVEAQIDSRLASSAARLASGDAALEAQMKTWLANLDQLKRALEQRPSLRTPEMQLITEAEWFEAAAAKLDSDEGLRRALASLRQLAANRLLNKIRVALSAYVAAHDGVLPEQSSRLLPYLDPPIDTTWLDRYEMIQSGKWSDVPAQSRMKLIASKTPVDVEYDTFWQAGVEGFSVTNAMGVNIAEARRAYSAANTGQHATTAAQLMPYLKWPASEAAVQKEMSPSPARR